MVKLWKSFALFMALVLVVALGAAIVPASPVTAATIQAAVDAASPGDTIIVDGGTYTENVVIDKSVTLIGAGAGSTIVDGGGTDRAFLIGSTDPSINVSISGMTIQNGAATVYGVVHSGAGIMNLATLTLSGCKVTENTAALYGAGITNAGTMTVDSCTISGNTVAYYYSFPWGPGGMWLGAGGGIMNGSGATLTMTQSTISGNSAARDGGGIQNGLYGPGGVLTMTNCTVSGNTAGSTGGGIGSNWTSGVPGGITLTNVTITNNEVTGGNNQGGGIFIYGGTHVVRNTIVANNIASVGPPNIMKSTCSWTASNCITSGDPLLGLLQDNGGPTETHALLLGSPAIDAGDDSVCPDTDQRGVPRPQGAHCDIGAYEFFLKVDIDIKPGSDPNSINLKSKGVVPVAVLTTDDFDAGTVDPDTVVFAGASPVRWATEDVDDDGDMDLLFHFKTQELSLDENSTEATLTGSTYGADPIEGTDTVRIVPKGK